jgi:hypothetical protein
MRYEITRNTPAPGDNPKHTSISDEYWHQAKAVALDVNGNTQESLTIVYQKTVFIPKWIPVDSLWLLVQPGSDWTVKVYG